MILKKIKESKQFKLTKRIWLEIAKPFWKWLFFGMIATIIAASGEAYNIALVRQIVDKAFIEKSISSLYLFGIQIIAAFGVKGAFNYIKDLIMSKAGLLAGAKLQNSIYGHLLTLDIENFNKEGLGKFFNYFSIHQQSVLSLVTSVFISFVQNMATLIMSIGLMIWFAPILCVVLLFLVPAILIPILIIRKIRKKLLDGYFNITNSILQHINQTLQGIKTIQIFSQENNESEKFKNIVNEYTCNAYKITQKTSIQTPVLELMISIGLCIALVIGGSLIIKGMITTGDFVGFLLALTAAYKPAKGMTGISGSLQSGLMSAEILFNFIDSKSVIKNGTKKINDKKLNIEFKNVSFSYIKDKPVLNNINFSVKSGQKIALVGESGGGKTTLFNLLERFYDVNKGQILINGINIKDLTLNSLRQNISEVSQDVFLFNDTIYNNIKYGSENATKTDVIKAAKLANADKFIKKLQNGYDTFVGERGVLLSGGQKQRIAIARAILKDSPILLLDEATSALDTESEKLIQESLQELMKGKTTFIIAHRLSTIINCDMIYVIKNGEIIENGNNQELLQINGEYKKLHDIQFK